MASLVDSSVWVALYLDDDSQHAKARQLVPTLRGPFYLPYGVLEETASVLTYKQSKATADQFVRFIETSEQFVYLEPDWRSDIAAFRGVSSRISFVDAMLLRLSRSLKDTELITFDQQLARLARRSRKK